MSNHEPEPPRPRISTPEDLTRIFCTAIVTTKIEELSAQKLNEELFQTLNEPAFQAVLNAVRRFAQETGLSERDAAEALIRAFRKMDSLWCQTLYREGMEKIRQTLG